MTRVEQVALRLSCDLILCRATAEPAIADDIGDPDPAIFRLSLMARPSAVRQRSTNLVPSFAVSKGLIRGNGEREARCKPAANLAKGRILRCRSNRLIALRSRLDTLAIRCPRAFAPMAPRPRGGPDRKHMWSVK
jgi:hypothetical protein